MKVKTIIGITIIFVLIVSSCLVKSLHPFYLEENIEFNPDLFGKWLDQDSSVWEFSIRTYTESFMGTEKQDKSYKVLYHDPSGDEPDSWFIVTLFKLKGATFLDFEPYVEDNIGDNMASMHFAPTHSVARVEFYGKNNLAFFWYDEEWLSSLFERNRVKISHEVISPEKTSSSKTYILTASSEELQKFLLKYGEEINVFKLINKENISKGKNSQEIFSLLDDEINQNMKEVSFSGNDLIYINMRKLHE
jgi:hypothetical protein